MKRCLVLLTFLNISSCKKLTRDPEFKDFIYSVKVDNKGSYPVALTIQAEGGNFNKCKKIEDRTKTLVPPGTKDTYSLTLQCLDPPAASYASFLIQKPLSDKAKAMKLAYAEFSDLKVPLTGDVDVAWRYKMVVTKAKTSTDPWIGYGGIVEHTDLPVSLGRPDVEGIQRSPVRILGKKLAVFVDVPDLSAFVDIGLPLELFPDGTSSSDGFVYKQALLMAMPANDGTAKRLADYPIQLVCDSDQCTMSLTN
jgi:hypothetical protein